MIQKRDVSDGCNGQNHFVIAARDVHRNCVLGEGQLDLLLQRLGQVEKPAQNRGLGGDETQLCFAAAGLLDQRGQLIVGNGADPVSALTQVDSVEVFCIHLNALQNNGMCLGKGLNLLQRRVIWRVNQMGLLEQFQWRILSFSHAQRRVRVWLQSLS